MELLFVIIGTVILLATLAALCLLVWWLWSRIRGGPKSPGPAAAADNGPLKEAPPDRKDKRELLLSKTQKALRPDSGFLISLGIVTLLTLLSGIPLLFINELVKKRTWFHESVLNSVSAEWGGPQILTGPILLVPYTVTYEMEEELVPSGGPRSGEDRDGGKGGDDAGDGSGGPEAEEPAAYPGGEGGGRRAVIVKRRFVERKTAYAIAEELEIRGELSTETRSRGIYDALVFSAALEVRGRFKKPDLSGIDKPMPDVHWNEARIQVGLSDARGIKSISNLLFGEVEIPFAPGGSPPKAFPKGYFAPVDLSGIADGGQWDFSFSLRLAASGHFLAAPSAQNASLALASPWPHPSFMGDGLPDSRETGDEGFKAQWHIPWLVHSISAVSSLEGLKNVSDDSEPYYSCTSDEECRGASYDRQGPFQEYLAGVALVSPVDHMSKVARSVRYGMLFIALTFLAYLLFKSKGAAQSLHLAQYLLITMSMALFYLILLAISEHLRFSLSFLLASAITVLMISIYVLQSLRSLASGAAMGLGLTILYALLYAILNLEDYALLAGTGLLTVALGALMYKTRSLAWESAPAAGPPKEPPEAA
ncbi:MAG: cell envelope integrity protein CreD [Deltaproteobacteria bacterium]|jgi:inner membrane protein|nr:cell envelope integrity protein CreD [Deltaproteobacteria bacterium]